jgi:flagellar FliJ protein
MAFHFNLQSVLDHKTHLEELAQHDLAARQAVLTQCEERLAWLGEELKRAQAKLKKKDTKGVTANEFVMANEYSTVLRLQALAQKAKIPMLQADVEQARLKLVEATKERKALELLKEKHKARFLRQELLAEQRILDEVAITAFSRRES